MPSSPSSRDRIELQAAGENLNTWGAPKLNAAIQRLEEAKDGRFAKVLSGNYALVATNYAADEARMAFLDFSGVGATVTIPGVEKTYLVRNATSGALVITTGSGTTATLQSGTTSVIATDGANVLTVGSNADNLAATLVAAKAYTDAASLAAGSLPPAVGLSDEFLATGPTGGGAIGVPAWVTNASARSKLGLGSSALVDIGTTGGAVPLLNGTNTWANVQTFTNGLTATNDITVNRSGASTTGYVFFGNTGTHYIGFDGTNFACGGTGVLQSPSGGFSGFLTGNISGSSTSCTGNAATATTAGSCTGNSATATALAAGNQAVAGALAISGTLTVQSDSNFGLHSAAGQYVLQMGAANGVNFDTGTGRINFLIGGVVRAYIDTGGIH